MPALAAAAALAVAAVHRTSRYSGLRVDDTAPVLNGDATVLRGARRHPATGRILGLSVYLEPELPWWQVPYWHLAPHHRLLTNRELWGDHPREAFEAAMYAEGAAAHELALHVAARRAGLPSTYDGTGALVEAVADGGPADGHIEAGDLIVAVDGTPIRSSGDLARVAAALVPGVAVVVTVDPSDPATEHDVRADRSVTAGTELRLGVLAVTAHPQRTGRLDARFDVPVGSFGPSMGLASVLALLDLTTDWDLRGATVAATGTIAADETVGEVVGVDYKAIAAARAGADVLLCPPGTAPGTRLDGMKIVEVGSLTDALDALA